MAKTYKLTTYNRDARPRSKRLRELGGSGGGTGSSTIVTVNSSGGIETPGTHSHANKNQLDQITTDTQGYLHLTQNGEVVDPDTGAITIERTTEKVKAGYADVAHDLSDDSPVRNEFLSRLADDVAAGRIAFEKGLIALANAAFYGGLSAGRYVQGVAGARIDTAGNGEFESLTARSYLKVFELIYNRLNALEGNTSFSDVGTIDAAEDTEGGQILTMRRRWDGDFTAFQPGDVIYGYVNDLENENGGNFYKAWAWVKSVDRTANTLTVAAYNDADTPAGTNYALRAGMVITRWGNNIEATALTYGNAEYSAVIQKRGEDYVNVRQSSFFISCEDGNLVELMGVNKPILERGNYGTILGKLPAGLLDSKTEELINQDQPYLYARGIVVQDLIRVGYEGVVTRTSNYRGTWSAETAASETDYYRSTTGVYDTVTWAGQLWQCVATGTTDEPSDETGSWVNMTGKQELPTLAVWKIIPNTDIVTLRYGADGNITIQPDTVSCAVLLTSTDEGTKTYNSSLDLSQVGVTLYYSLDGTTWKEFIIGNTEPLETEDGEDVIELESSTDESPAILMLGGDDVSATEIGDRLYFELRNDTDVLARSVIPIVKDGYEGKDGNDGLMVYPAGYYSNVTFYDATEGSAPVVMYEDNYYVLKRGKTYRGIAMPLNRYTPAADVANGGDDVRWQIFDKFNAIFADIVMADFAKLSSAVFYGDYMISQQGTVNGVASNDYQLFRDGTFIPNFSVNFKTGEMRAGSGVFSGSLRTALKPLAESDAIDVGEATLHIYANRRYRINKDLQLHVSSYSELELPTDTSYVGARITICESAGVYSRNLGFVIVVAQNGEIIGGIRAENSEYEWNAGAKRIDFLNGTVEFLGVQDYEYDDNNNATPCTKWMITNASAQVLLGYKTITGE